MICRYLWLIGCVVRSLCMMRIQNIDSVSWLLPRKIVYWSDDACRIDFMSLSKILYMKWMGQHTHSGVFLVKRSFVVDLMHIIVDCRCMRADHIHIPNRKKKSTSIPWASLWLWSDFRALNSIKFDPQTSFKLGIFRFQLNIAVGHQSWFYSITQFALEFFFFFFLLYTKSNLLNWLIIYCANGYLSLNFYLTFLFRRKLNLVRDLVYTPQAVKLFRST